MFLKLIPINNRITFQLTRIIITKFIKTPFYARNRKMDEAKIYGNFKQLYGRLQEANKQAEILSDEVKDIRKQIRLLSECNLFKDLVDQFNRATEERTNSTSGGAKRRNDEADGALDKDLGNDSKRIKSDFNKSEDYVIVYTDGACENNGRANAKAGIGVWFGENHSLNLAKPVDGKATNNTAEIQACICALRIAKEEGIKKILIRTDSQFTINCITNWIKRWKKNNWKTTSGAEVKNKIDLMKLDKLCEDFDNIKWEHVAGHQGIKGNEEADKLARQGALSYSNKT